MVDKIWYNMEELIGGSEERVLIETQWNVKTERIALSWIHQTSINRNIVECKDEQYDMMIDNKFRINRNIVECKDSFTGFCAG